MANGNGLNFDVSKLLLTFLCMVFTAVSFWMGKTVSDLAGEFRELRVTLEMQTKTSDHSQTQIDRLSGEVVSLREELARRGPIIRALSEKVLGQRVEFDGKP